jgi:5-methylcytosine-specific restriction endonuclease McrA
MKSTLVLNASYEPMSIVNGHRGVNLVLSGKATSLDDSPEALHSNSLIIPVPYVIKLNYFVKRPQLHKPLPFSKKGVMVRDGYKCAYCKSKADTIDHIIPRSKGGENSYLNCVASCIKCNSYKRDRFLKETGMTLHHNPYEPSIFNSFLFKVMHDEHMFQSWSTYIYMFAPAVKAR